MDGKETVWRRFAARGVRWVCRKEPDGWHAHELVDGKYVDKGLCKHDHSDGPLGEC
jgi:hypothetical protein